ncbi:MAG: dockerin type I repeat-containing protein [Lachnospiraceae bacterium]
MKKLISSLTALTLAVASSVPMLSNAVSVLPMKQGSVDDMVKANFGEDAIYIYDKSSIHNLVFSPEDFGYFNRDEGNLKVKLKSDSEFDAETLQKFIWKNCTSYVDCEKCDDEENTYILNRSEIYAGPSSRMEEEIYPAVISFLIEECEDVVSIDKYYNVSVNTYAEENSDIFEIAFLVSDNVDFDFEKYSNYKIETCIDNGGLFEHKYYVVTANKGDNFFKDTYDAFINLYEDYGDKDVRPGMSGYGHSNPFNQAWGENIYTAGEVSISDSLPNTAQVNDTDLISGDTNADGEVNISDVLAITAYIANPAENQLSETALINADVNGDGAVTANDALTIQQYLADIITEL